MDAQTKEEFYSFFLELNKILRTNGIDVIYI